MQKHLFAIVFAALASMLPAQVAPPPTDIPLAPQPAAELRAVDAVILGVIEGLTEFLPVSSTGHLIIAKDLLRLNSNQVLFDSIGEPLWYRHATSEHGSQLLTMNLAADTYILVIQFGAAAAVAIVYWSQLLSMIRGLFGRDPAGLRLLITVAIAFVPAAVFGLLFHDWIDENLYSVGTVIVAQVLGAMLMFYTEAWYARRYLQGILPETKELTPVAAATVGLLQCVAILPGTSRPMMAIVGGYFAGLDPRRAAEFSFILGFVTVTAASIYKSFRSGAAMIQVFGWPHVLLGGAVAAVVAAVCIRFTVHLLLRHGLNFFAWYRIALAGALAWHYYG
ncbi:undecaprenyl-diphosphate phosphatase [Horticoccus sp. 23ND18S-11]|uniref:undecaprenyl-diphosphate phosphatase n=1 Tax=Horticoccus sp. 23ND18S-11 TaxID=3391832 RepID=UPI0039C95EED